MKLSIATLCDRAVVREGLLHILGAGITNTRTPLPSALQLDVGLMFQLEPSDGGDHRLSVLLLHEDTGDKVGQVIGLFQIPSEDVTSEKLPLGFAPLTIPLSAMAVSKAGFYGVTVVLDDEEVARLRLRVFDANEPGGNDA